MTKIRAIILLLRVWQGNGPDIYRVHLSFSTHLMYFHHHMLSQAAQIFAIPPAGRWYLGRWQAYSVDLPEERSQLKGLIMKWITRERPKTDRIACPWLIKHFIDANAEIIFVPANQVLAEAERLEAYSFDAPSATYTHRGNLCTFEVLIDEYKLGVDPALTRLAKIVHAADISDDLDTDPLGAGLLAIGIGGLSVETDDICLLERSEFVYDALYAWCQH